MSRITIHFCTHVWEKMPIEGGLHWQSHNIPLRNAWYGMSMLRIKTFFRYNVTQNILWTPGIRKYGIQTFMLKLYSIVIVLWGMSGIHYSLLIPLFYLWSTFSIPYHYFQWVLLKNEPYTYSTVNKENGRVF